MALLDPERTDVRDADGKLHPCLYLIAGFGVITVAAVAVHVIFNIVV